MTPDVGFTPALPKDYRSAGQDHGEEQMNGASRFGFAAICILLAVSSATAADLTAPAEPPPPPAPTIYVHGGLIGSWANANASPTGGGLFATQVTTGGLFVGASNIAISPV